MQKQHLNQHTQHYSNADKPSKSGHLNVELVNVLALMSAKDY